MPRTLEGQILAILAISFVLLLSVLIGIEVSERRTPLEWAASKTTLVRIERMRVFLEAMHIDKRAGVLDAVSSCHDGYTLSAERFAPINKTARTHALEVEIATSLAMKSSAVSLGFAALGTEDFSYGFCSANEIRLPMNAVVISVQLASGDWFSLEVHPHEWHAEDWAARLLRYIATFLLVGLSAMVLIRRLSRPLQDLTQAADQFASGLTVSQVDERGPPDLVQAIKAFNAMQRQVASHVQKRTETLAAISHDLRSPLTAMRIKAEFVEDENCKAELIALVDRMERFVASALEYLGGGTSSEPLRKVDLSALLGSECSDFNEAGLKAIFRGEYGVVAVCRPEALSRAVRNLIENANRYAGEARVSLCKSPGKLHISVEDSGPGIPDDKLLSVREPFVRLSKARESHVGGFGLGLATVDGVAKNHDGALILEANEPAGLRATIVLPIRES